MHEYSLACSIAEICQESAQANSLTVITRVALAAGPLASAHEETLAFLFGEVAQQYGIGRPALTFARKPLIVICASCGAETAMDAPDGGFCELWHNPEGAALPEACPACGSRDISFPGASLLEVESIEGEQDNAAGG
jgi:Zn finger protein HypA/HybF involved in hydrogenase expression